MRSIIFLLLFAPILLNAQIDTTEKSLVKWMTIEQADELCKTQPRPLLIDIYTNWCGWCKYMLQTTYSNQGIANFINNFFYPVQINAETKDTLTYKGKIYPPQGKYNSLAVELTNGRLSFPTTVFVTTKDQRFPIPGYLEPHNIEPFLIYFKEELWTSVDLNVFRTAFMFKYPKNFTKELEQMPAEQKPDTLGKPNWISFEKAAELSEKEKKKYILFAYVEWCNSCKVMEKISFSNSLIADEINKNFYLISFDAATPNTISINGHQYKSLGQGQPNELAMEIFQQQFFFPAIIFLNEDFKVLTVIKAYMTPEQLEPILFYFSSNSYLDTKFEDYFKTFESKLK